MITATGKSGQDMLTWQRPMSVDTVKQFIWVGN